jgi:aminoglycoside phosphotransferase (APT) family kinase protein
MSYLVTRWFPAAAGRRAGRGRSDRRRASAERTRPRGCVAQWSAACRQRTPGLTGSPADCGLRSRKRNRPRDLAIPKARDAKPARDDRRLAPVVELETARRVGDHRAMGEMESADPQRVVDAFRNATNLAPQTLAASRLDVGYGHENWQLADDAGNRWILKIAERERRTVKVENNVAAQRRAAAHGVRVPEVIALCLDPEPLGRPFYVQRWVEGTDAEVALAAMSAAERAFFAAEYGTEVARLHAITDTHFSEGVLAALRHAGWKEYCVARLDLLRKVNFDAGVLDPTTLAATLLTCGRLVEEMTVDFAPGLAHLDLYPRNVVVSPTGHLAALLDFEHSRFTDPAWDFVKLETWNFRVHPDLAQPFLAAYRAERGWSDGWDARLRLCRGLEYLVAIPYFATRFRDDAALRVFLDAIDAEFGAGETKQS